MHTVVEQAYMFKVDFELKPNKQKFLIEILMVFWGVKLKNLAQIIGVPTDTLESVLSGQAYLGETVAFSLVQFFCLACGG